MRPLRLVSWMALAGITLAAATLGFASKIDVSSVALTDVTGATQVAVSTCTVAASADSYVDEGQPATTQGGAVVMKVRSQLSANQRPLVRFDLGGCSIPQGASVRTARLDLYLVAAPSASRSYGVHTVAGAWDEATATWNNQPGAAATATATTASGTSAGVTLSWDVVADVRGFVSGTTTNNGWVVKDQSEGASDPGFGGELGAREGGSAQQRPSLVISYYP